ncbi:MAG: CotH kinase family protein [Clostridia bacterium]|nr:CotH kinase family protein [Clostridia bacterium]
MVTRRKLMGTLLIVLALVALMTPLALRLTRELAAQKAADQALLDMHIAHTAHLEESRGSALLEIIDIEEAWALEDTRAESETPLVTAMYNGDAPLGFDREYRTFYCTLGMDGEEWPELALTAKGEDGVQVAWIDDYTYDWRADALAEGYGYELIAYTDTAYEYIYVVFTGLPIVSLHVQQEIGDTYIPCRTTVSGAGAETIDSASLVHTRGGGFYKGIDKQSYRVEFHGVSKGGRDEKKPVSVLGMPADTDWLLVSNAGDDTCMRNYLSFELWKKWNAGGYTITPLESRMVEVFVNDEYMGLYQLMPRIRADEEITEMGGELDRDTAARMIGERYETGKPLYNAHEEIDGVLELRYAPQGVSVKDAFERYMPYVAMNLPETNPDYLSDEAFAQLALGHVDVRDVISYYLFMEATSMTPDNVKNNLYIWALGSDVDYTYRFSPWDMDSCLKPLYSSEANFLNFYWPIATRTLGINIGNARQIMRDLWEEKRATILSEDALYQWFLAAEEEINASGAYLRETERWRGGAQPLDLGEISAFVIDHMNAMERILYDTWPLDVPAVDSVRLGE